MESVTIIMPTWIDAEHCPDAMIQTHIARRGHFPGMLDTLRAQAGIDHRLIVASGGGAIHDIDLHRFLYVGLIDQLLLHGRNIGMGHLRRNAARMVDTDWICFLDDDFDFTADWLLRMIDLAKAQNAVVGGHKWRGQNSEPGSTSAYKRITYAPDNCMVMLTNDYHRIGGYEHDGPSRASHFLLSIGDLGKPTLIPMPEPCIHWGLEYSTYFQRQGEGWRLVWKGPDDGLFPGAGPR